MSSDVNSPLSNTESAPSQSIAEAAEETRKTEQRADRAAQRMSALIELLVQLVQLLQEAADEAAAIAAEFAHIATARKGVSADKTQQLADGILRLSTDLAELSAGW